MGSMNKLELKQIVGYLPYGLKMQLKGNYPIKEGEDNIIEDYQILDIKRIERALRDANFKPILRPISDLIKEIKHNGEKFVPIEYLTKWADLNTDMFELRFENLLFVLYNKKKGFYQINDNNFSFFEKLYEWHFDIHDLIGKGLAIDINTLKP